MTEILGRLLEWVKEALDGPGSPPSHPLGLGNVGPDPRNPNYTGYVVPNPTTAGPAD